MITHLTLAIAGLGLFFAGMQILTEHLKQLTGRRFRLWVAHWTRHRLIGTLWGAAFISITQSGAATTFIIISLLAAGLIGVVQALPMIIGLNVGGSVMVLVVTSDIKVIVLLVLGVAGIGYASQHLLRWRSLIRALFGAGVLYLGLSMIQEGAAPIAQQPWAQELLTDSSNSPLLGFLVGIVLVVMTQSSIAIGVLAITLCKAGMLSLDQTIMILYGANLGSSIGTYLLSAQLAGRSRQVGMYQVFYNFFGCLIFVPLFYLEWLAGIPLVKAFVVSLSNDIGMQLAIVFIIFNLIPGILLLFSIQPVAQILQHFWPPSPVEYESRPQYLHRQALNEPESALNLVHREHCRLFSYLLRYLMIAREPGESPQVALIHRREVFTTVSTEVHHFLGDMVATNPSPQTYQRIGESLALHSNLERINATLAELVKQLVKIDTTSPLKGLASHLIEGLEALLLTLNESLDRGADALELEMIGSMVDGRRGILRQIRETYLTGSQDMDGKQKRQLLEITNHCERLFWLIGQLQPHLTSDEHL